MGETDIKELSEFNRRSILEGSQVDTFKQMYKDFSGGFMDLEEFQQNGLLAESYIKILPEANLAMEEIKLKEKEQGVSFPTYEDYCPEAWKSEDPDLEKKIDLFQNYLEESVRMAKEKSGQKVKP